MDENLSKLDAEKINKFYLAVQKLYKTCLENGYNDSFQNFILDLIKMILYNKQSLQNSDSNLENIAGGTSNNRLNKALAGMLSALSLGAASTPVKGAIPAPQINRSLSISRAYNLKKNKPSNNTQELLKKIRAINSSTPKSNKKIDEGLIHLLAGEGTMMLGSVATMLILIYAISNNASLYHSTLSADVLTFCDSLSSNWANINNYNSATPNQQKKRLKQMLLLIYKNGIYSGGPFLDPHFRNDKVDLANKKIEEYVENNVNNTGDPLKELDMMLEIIQINIKKVSEIEENPHINDLKIFENAVLATKKIISTQPIPDFSLHQASSTQAPEETVSSDSNPKVITSENLNNKNAQQSKESFASLSENIAEQKNSLRQVLNSGTSFEQLPTLFNLNKWCNENISHTAIRASEKKEIEEIERQVISHGNYIIKNFCKDNKLSIPQDNLFLKLCDKYNKDNSNTANPTLSKEDLKSLIIHVVNTDKF